MTTPEQRLAEQGLKIPEMVAPFAAYAPAVRHGSQIWVSGQLPVRDGKLVARGVVGTDVTTEQATEAARQAALNAIAAVRENVDNLSQVAQILKVVIFVASAPGYEEQGKVGNGASELLGAVFGDAGVHARSAIGVAALPLGAAVEVELVAAISEA
ncbi:RidA family protein [Streptomyces sp. NPDC053560]|uniref:RidA family protein n=1 Tax=Streptomyces sp. NPDC053560 TaxID=3365711 RepID=UPI0037D56383